MSDIRGATEVNGIKEYRYFADCEWRTAESNKLFDAYRPYDRGLYARVAAGGGAEATLAVDAAATGVCKRHLTSLAQSRPKSVSRGFADEESGRLVRLNLHDRRGAAYIEQMVHVMGTPPGVAGQWLIDHLAASSAAANPENARQLGAPWL